MHIKSRRVIVAADRSNNDPRSNRDDNSISRERTCKSQEINHRAVIIPLIVLSARSRDFQLEKYKLFTFHRKFCLGKAAANARNAARLKISTFSFAPSHRTSYAN